MSARYPSIIYVRPAVPSRRVRQRRGNWQAVRAARFVHRLVQSSAESRAQSWVEDLRDRNNDRESLARIFDEEADKAREVAALKGTDGEETERIVRGMWEAEAETWDSAARITRGADS